MKDKYETLKNMNGTTAKHAQWCVRILDPKVIDYTFTARSEKVNATRFECLIVSKDPKQYMLASVPFRFDDRDASKKASDKFKDQAVWIIKTPAFDTKQKPEYNSCPLKAVVLLQSPSKMTAATPANTAELGYPSTHVEVELDLKGILRLLASMPFDKASSRTGSAKPQSQSKVLDFCGKKLSLASQKPVAKAGKSYKVSEMELVDHTGGKIQVSVWDNAYDLLVHIPDSEGITCVGATATREGSEVKLNLWPDAHVLRGGDRAQSLTSLDPASLSVELLTATFTPAHTPIDVDGDAHPSCAAALAEAVGCSGDKVFQINRAMIEAPTHEDAMFTQDRRLFVPGARLRDRTGGVTVDVVASAVPALYGCSDEAELQDKLQKGTLEPQLDRVSVRGVLRAEAGAVKKFIAKVGPSPLINKLSLAALRAAVGLTEIVGDLVIPAPVDHVADVPLVGLAVRSDFGLLEWLRAHRVLLLVEGTRESTLDPVGESAASLQEQSFKVHSPKVRCLLSANEQYVDLVGYCSFAGMLTYRLDKDVALVLVSAVAPLAPDSVSAGGPAFVATIEHMRKVGADEKASLLVSLATEWKSVLGQESKPEGVSATQSEYWDQPASKLRRLESEPRTPVRP